MKQTITEKCTNLCQEHGAHLLYLVKFGSHLYGTSTEASDTDYKGIFLPSKESCLLGTAPRAITQSSGDTNGRNTADDVDIQLWSLQYFLQLLGKGEVNALDLAYSPTFPAIIEFSHDAFTPFLLYDKRRFFDVADCNAFVGYAIGQAKKYGIKGSRMGVLKDAIKITNGYMQTLGEESGSAYLSSKFTKISDLIGIIDYTLHDDSYCFIKQKNDSKFLCLCGKMHQETITVHEFYKRLCDHYEQYGTRAEEARKNKGVDFKALSHAVRCLHQMQMLITLGNIRFPLRTAKQLLEIKQGKEDFTTLEKLINQKIDEVKSMLAAGPGNYPALKKIKDQGFVNRFVLSCYDYFY